MSLLRKNVNSNSSGSSGGGGGNCTVLKLSILEKILIRKETLINAL